MIIDPPYRLDKFPREEIDFHATKEIGPQGLHTVKPLTENFNHPNPHTGK